MFCANDLLDDRLRDWLEERIGNSNYPGLEWIDREKKIFKISWKHGARQGWREEKDARIFREWSEHTGTILTKYSKYQEGQYERSVYQSLSLKTCHR